MSKICHKSQNGVQIVQNIKLKFRNKYNKQDLIIKNYTKKGKLDFWCVVPNAGLESSKRIFLQAKW